MSRLSTLITIIFYCSHCFACMWFYAGSADEFGWATVSRRGLQLQYSLAAVPVENPDG